MDATQSPDTTLAPPPVEEKPKKARKVKPSYPGLLDASGNAQKLTEWPADFNDEFKALKKDNFVDRTVWYAHHAERLEEEARELWKAAEEEKMYGDPETRKRAQKAKALKNQMDEIVKQLIIAGVDVDGLWKTMN